MEQELARAPKTWGPFTGRQLTTIICVVTATVAFPVGAFAVAGSNSFVTDAVSGKQATVNVNKQLEVHTNNSVDKLAGATSGNKAEVTKGNQLQVAEAPPSSFYSGQGSGSALQPTAVATPPTGKALIIKNVHLGTFNSTGLDPYVSLYLSADACATAVVNINYYEVPSGASATLSLPFEPGIVVPAGSKLCVHSSDADVDGAAIGYSVAASAVTAPVAGKGVSPRKPGHH